MSKQRQFLSAPEKPAIVRRHDAAQQVNAFVELNRCTVGLMRRWRQLRVWRFHLGATLGVVRL